MIYVYQCSVCGNGVMENRPVAQRDDPVTCLCGRDMRRQILVPQIVTQLQKDRPENKRCHGDLSDQRAYWKWNDKMNERLDKREQPTNEQEQKDYDDATEFIRANNQPRKHVGDIVKELRS